MIHSPQEGGNGFELDGEEVVSGGGWRYQDARAGPNDWPAVANNIAVVLLMLPLVAHSSFPPTCPSMARGRQVKGLSWQRD
ncbi:hypothetical protein LY76DRAFT_674242 [Colletotrichum caudatum]|nr:hypothetical protein LY76DRAFT_674242 [Colletotrichum caudatum]